MNMLKRIAVVVGIPLAGLWGLVTIPVGATIVAFVVVPSTAVYSSGKYIVTGKWGTSANKIAEVFDAVADISLAPMRSLLL